jgi:metal-responsive CopG/Arc/MetJ family transcriptional regulator
MRTERKIVLGISFPIELLEALDKMADQDGRSRSAYVTHLIRQEIRKTHKNGTVKNAV